MNRSVLYRFSQVIAGGCLTVLAISGVWSNDLDSTIMLVTIAGALVGGVGMILGNSYYVLNPAADGFEPGPVPY